jgi:hypothetical protein
LVTENTKVKRARRKRRKVKGWEEGRQAERALGGVATLPVGLSCLLALVGYDWPGERGLACQFDDGYSVIAEETANARF